MNNITPYMERQVYIKLLEQECGYEKAHMLIDRALLEYSMIMNSSKVETR